MPISNKILNVTFFLLTGIMPFSQGDLVAKKDKVVKNRKSTSVVYEDPVEKEYWEGQKKYMVDPSSYYGSMPEDLEMAVFMLQNKEEFEKAGLYKTSNFIFYGPPGVGKTYVGSIFAQKIGAEFMYVQGSELQDVYVGGHRKPEELFARARSRRDQTGKPVVMFIDEIEAIVGSRDRWGTTPNEQQMIAALLKEIGAAVNDRIIVVAATNKIERVDEALLRSGRMEHHIEFTYPNLQDREKFIEFIIKPFPNIFDSKIAWTVIAQQLAGKTFADISKIINDLKRACVVKRITTKNSTAIVTYNDIANYLNLAK